MRGQIVQCGLCGTTVKLGKAGRLPEHMTHGYRPRRCNGVRRGLVIAEAAKALTPRQDQWRRAARTRELRFHQSGKSLENDPAQRHRWLYRNGWLPAQQARQWDQVYPWNYQVKYGRSYAW